LAAGWVQAHRLWWRRLVEREIRFFLFFSYPIDFVYVLYFFALISRFFPTFFPLIFRLWRGSFAVILRFCRADCALTSRMLGALFSVAGRLTSWAIF
jgi:hypothetical protein